MQYATGRPWTEDALTSKIFISQGDESSWQTKTFEVELSLYSATPYSRVPTPLCCSLQVSISLLDKLLQSVGGKAWIASTKHLPLYHLSC